MYFPQFQYLYKCVGMGAFESSIVITYAVIKRSFASP